MENRNINPNSNSNPKAIESKQRITEKGSNITKEFKIYFSNVGKISIVTKDASMEHKKLPFQEFEKNIQDTETEQDHWSR